MYYNSYPSQNLQNHSQNKKNHVQSFMITGFCVALLLGLFVVSQYNYLLFHTVAELFSIAVAWGVFLLVWNIRPYMRNDALFFLGISYLFIGFFDLLHTLAYKGMGVFELTNEPDLAIQLWISARGIETLALFLFPLFLGKRLRSDILLGILFLISSFIMASIFSWNLYPRFFIEGYGLTYSKVWTEYILCLIVLISIFLLYRKREFLDLKVYYYMLVSMFLTIAAELSFTLYVEVYSFSNLIGHYFKILSFFFIYISLIRSGLTNPYSLLFKELYQDKEALRESERRHRLLFENAANGVALHEIILNAQGEPIDYVFLETNPAFEVQSGLKADQVLGRRATEVIPGIQNSSFIGMYGQVVQSGVSINVEQYSEHLQRHYYINAYKVSDGQFATVFQDITERKEREEQLQEARRQAEEASKAKSNFLAKMSHEIRTPMNSILGMLRLALSGSLQGKQRERIQVAKDSAESLLWLLNDLLDLSKIEADKFTLNEKEFHLRHLMKSVSKENEAMAEEKGLKQYLNLDQNLPAVSIGDWHRLKRILFNLLSNAIKYTDWGWISLQAEQLDVTPCSDQEDLLTTTILFKVQDTGCGIDSKRLQCIFEPYDQGGQVSSSANTGIGLGLAICKKFSEQMSGRIWAESKPGEGSTFYFQLPLKTNKHRSEKSENCVQVDDQTNLAPQRILLVEDQKMNQIFATDLLTSYGHHVVVAENGEYALDCLAKSSFDLVLMDIWLPVMDGIETTLRIRTADPQVINPDIPVIGLSAHMVTEKELDQFINAGFNHYLVKPLSFEKLFAAMKAELSNCTS